MHERKVMNDLVEELERIARSEEAPIVRIRVRLGALSHFTPEHFREHFADATAGTQLSVIEVETEQSDDMFSPAATGVLLQSVEVSA